MFAGKIETSRKVTLASSIAHKYGTQVEVAGNDKRTSLLYFNINYQRKRFYSVGPKIHSVSECNLNFPKIIISNSISMHPGPIL